MAWLFDGGKVCHRHDGSVAQDEGTTAVYRVVDWDRNFENNRTRELKKLDWVPFPNRHDGDGYTELLDHDDGAAHYGAWCALVQVASKCEPRGTLSRDGARPHDARSLARMTRIEEGIMTVALDRLVSEVKWLEIVPDIFPHLPAAIPHPAAEGFLHQNTPPADTSISPPADTNCSDEIDNAYFLSQANGAKQDKQIPQAGAGKRLRKGREGNTNTGRVFVRPTVGEVADYCAARGNQVDPQAFIDHYTANGWKVGRAAMRDWQASVRTWERRISEQSRGEQKPAALPFAN